MLRSSNPGTFAGADMRRYVEAWSRPRAMHSMINWYRAMARTRTARLPNLRVSIPTRIIWGARDVALSSQMASLSLEMCDDDADLFLLENATHWVQHDEPQRVNELILEFLQRP
jgi:pimeloyl-ACP methyl ester carboxylesterase